MQLRSLRRAGNLCAATDDLHFLALTAGGIGLLLVLFFRPRGLMPEPLPRLVER